MNYEETLAIMGVLKAAYPQYYRDMKRSDAESVVSLWAEMFKEEPVNVVAVAVKAYIASDTKGFPPHIGAIKDAIVKIKAPKSMTEQEAWLLVKNATRNGLYGSAEEFEKLPPICKKLVGSPSQLREWATMDSDTLNSVVASNFQRSYKVMEKREKERLALPSDVRDIMAQLSGGFKMLEA